MKVCVGLVLHVDDAEVSGYVSMGFGAFDRRMFFLPIFFFFLTSDLSPVG